MDVIRSIQDYKDDLLNHYILKKENGELDSNLYYPTLASLRDLLLLIYNNQKDIKDLKIIMLFFSEGDASIDFNKKIKREENKFRSIADNIKNLTLSLKTPSLDLIALLLDFKQRPYFNYQKGNFEDKLESILKESLSNQYLNSDEFRSIRINGDFDHLLGRLSMNDYYVQLSYLTHYNLQARDSLLYLEKESAYYKIKNRISDLSQGYISQSILKSNRIIVTGNPGIGKSTFAKWLCFNWASNDLEKGNVFIYIELRRLNFKKKDFLFKYIKEYYLTNTEEEYKSLKVLLKNIDNYKMILDGFDELNSIQKQQLIIKIKNLKYVVLTRPYGLININNLEYDFILQIDGFNSHCIDNYIDNILNNKKSEGKSKQEILTIITDNKVLYDYAHTPLMLSYILLLYLKSNDVIKELSSIDSIYELQEKVYDWILFYASGKEVKIDLSEKMKREMSKFSYKLLLDKQYTYTASLDDKYYNITKNLSKLGLGSQRKIDYKWQYSFYTVTFQEFLAARYLKETFINNESFLYLISDQFFWNYCLLLVGMISKENISHKELENSLNFIRQFYNKKKFNYYIYAYFMLLGECNTKLVTKVITKKEITSIFNFYKEAYFDEFWQGVSQESISKIIYKASFEMKELFVDKVVKKIAATTKLSTKNSDIIILDESLYYLSDLIAIAKDYNEQLVLQALLLSIENLVLWRDKIIAQREILKSNQRKNNTREDEQLRDQLLYVLNTSKNFVNDLELFSKISIDKAAIKTSRITSLISFSDIQTLELIVVHFGLKIHPPSTIEFDYNTFKKKYNEGAKTVKEQHRAIETIINYSQRVFQILSFNQKLSKTEANHLKYISEWMMENTEKFDFNKINQDKLNYLIDLLIINLTKCNNLHLLDTLFEFAQNYNSYLFSPIPDHDGFIEYLNTFFRKAESETNSVFLKKLHFIISEAPNIKSSFALVKDQLLGLFNVILKKINQNNYDSPEKKIAKQILIGIARVPSENYDKKYFINAINHKEIIKDDPNFIPYEIVLKVLFVDFVFYEEKNWKLIKDIQDLNTKEIIPFLSILTSKELYFLKSNHKHLINLFFRLFDLPKKYPKKMFYYYGMELMTLASYMLFFIKSFKNNSLTQKVLDIIKGFLDRKEIKEAYREFIVDMTIVECSIAYVLYYFYRPSNNHFLIDINLYDKLTDEPGAKVEFFNILLEFTKNKEYGVEIQELELLKPILKEKLFAELIELMNQRLINKNTFDPKYFNMLLSSSSCQNI